LGSCAFARHYWRNHYCFLFLQVLRCFSSLGLLPDLHRSNHCWLGCPIRTPADQFLFADPRSFSQLTTSFFAFESLGIPHTPFLTSIYRLTVSGVSLRQKPTTYCLISKSALQPHRISFTGTYRQLMANSLQLLFTYCARLIICNSTSQSNHKH
jgi:hypothetical protein